MESLAKTLNAPMDIEFDGQTYQLSALDLNDLGQLENYLKQERIKNTCSLDIDKAQIRDMVAEIHRQSIDVEELMTHIQTVNGLKYVMWLCIKKHNDKVTLKDIGEKIDLNKMVEKLVDILAIPEVDEGEQGEKKPLPGTS